MDETDTNDSNYIAFEDLPLLAHECIFKFMDNETRNAMRLVKRYFYSILDSARFRLITLFFHAYRQISLTQINQIIESSPLKSVFNFNIFYHPQFDDSFWITHGERFRTIALMNFKSSGSVITNILSRCIYLEKLKIKTSFEEIIICSNEMVSSQMRNTSLKKLTLLHQFSTQEIIQYWANYLEFLQVLPNMKKGELFLSESMNSSVIAVLNKTLFPRNNITIKISSFDSKFKYYYVKSSVGFTIPMYKIGDNFDIQQRKHVDICDINGETENVVEQLINYPNIETLFVRKGVINEDFFKFLAKSKVRTLMLTIIDSNDCSSARMKEVTNDQQFQNIKIQNLFLRTINGFGFAHLFKNVKKINIHKISMEDLKLISENCFMLEELEIGDTCSGNGIRGVCLSELTNLRFLAIPDIDVSFNLPNLKTFVVYVGTSFTVQDNQTNFFTTKYICPKLEMLSIPNVNFLEDLNTQIIRIIKPLKKIKGFHLQMALSEKDVNIKTINDTCPSLCFISYRSAVIYFDGRYNATYTSEKRIWKYNGVMYDNEHELWSTALSRRCFTPSYNEISKFLYHDQPFYSSKLAI